MASYVGREAPYFKAEAVFADNTFGEVNLHDFIGKKYVLLYFYPLDFTFVCPSEIIALDKALDSFKERNVELIGCSVDSKYTHLAWKKTPLAKGGIGNIQHTLISDITKSISRSYNVLFGDSVSLRAFVLIDKQGVVQHLLVNNLAIGRSVEEVLRIIDAVQHHEQHGDVCPANWKKGKVAMKPSEEGVSEYLSKL
ncbi:thioredoxin peroxidase 1 [Plasmodium gaboni]|uniref:Thioredoxin peroxidase 1 n=1 Tax=Plasmodium gaboni TaxID=647221 RepID=A0A151LAJ6_9APIC|nr:thioredoxin peroxidase 1 [Plasmodium gaboni]KYN95983.1 thioredoxin peroxidase 1 [Plasmodium gaboni]SOV19194.1 thioredoxin peroxidase 1 [Plasmodium gaboni]SOV25110.1 thioredoxin peroxidase 1 [Plasmodium sp. DRC-Itaito]